MPNLRRALIYLLLVLTLSLGLGSSIVLVAQPALASDKSDDKAAASDDGGEAEAGPWLAPQTIVKTLARIEQEFGEDARFVEILIDDSKARVLVEDPQNPGMTASYLVDANSIAQFGTPMPWEANLQYDRSFTLADLGWLDADKIAELQEATLTRMNLKGAEVYRLTVNFGDRLIPDDNAPLQLEIRAGKDDGYTGGWLIFDMDGAVIDTMLP